MNRGLEARSRGSRAKDDELQGLDEAEKDGPAGGRLHQEAAGLHRRTGWMNFRLIKFFF